ncbi:Bifunctional F420 biosynthesis protein FbiB [Neolewinella maritima]|uniref:Bifunctional F420 biosynthesis protein FbiB n=1 Tax=Neolewinella maritima TaxID=1383882 RepID=A0ABM9B3D0_9BACT|nr:nitroreductase family protein [Neolewinella maritima]CAH1001684.1 Bifunctional F420 biosynthesis protein FbiB [Neolewinella maritima]
MSDYVPLSHHPLDEQRMLQAVTTLYERLASRRTVRDFSPAPVARAVIEHIVATACTAPSGAHKQPWHFCIVSDPAIKQQIREAAEREEYENYHGRMSDDWLADLQKFGTDWNKPFLTTAPYLIVVFKKPYDLGPDGDRQKNYYVNESVGIACGMLIAAIHLAGLVTVTHTPSPMNFLQQVLDRPDNERAYLLLPVGLPAEGATVPTLERKPLEEVLTWYDHAE